MNLWRNGFIVFLQMLGFYIFADAGKDLFKLRQIIVIAG